MSEVLELALLLTDLFDFKSLVLGDQNVVLFALQELHCEDVLLLLVEQLLIKVSNIPIRYLIFGSSDQNLRIGLTKAQIDHRVIMSLENPSSGTRSVLPNINSIYLTSQPNRFGRLSR